MSASGRMFQQPGTLTAAGSSTLQFKVPGKPALRCCKVGKKVWVDRHQLDYGMFVVWANATEYALIGGEELHQMVEF